LERGKLIERGFRPLSLRTPDLEKGRGKNKEEGHKPLLDAPIDIRKGGSVLRGAALPLATHSRSGEREGED